jgi:hypothetical protein
LGLSSRDGCSNQRIFPRHEGRLPECCTFICPQCASQAARGLPAVPCHRWPLLWPDGYYHGGRHGVRQGCLLSGTIFAVAFQPWLLWVQSQMRLRVCMKFNRAFAFADDLLLLLQDLWGVLVHFHSCCSVLFHATGLELNIRKTCIVPLWPRADFSAARQRLSSMIPGWKEVLRDSAYKYLCVYIGPDAHSRRWLGVSQSTIRRCF